MNEDKGLRALNRSIPLVLCFFLLVGFFPLIRYPSSILYDWFSRPNVSGIYWSVDAFLYLAFAIWVWVKNKAQPALRYALMFLWVFLYALIVAFIHDKSLDYADPNGLSQTYHLGFMAVFVAVEGTMFDLLFCFAFLFLWPFCKKEPKFKNVLLGLLVIIAIASFSYSFVKGADPAKSYPYYTSFYSTNEDFGKVVFLGVFASAVMAYDYTDIRRWLFLTLAIAFVVLTALNGLAMTFWCLIGASFIISFYLYNVSAGRQGDKSLRVFKRLSLLYVLGIVVLVILILAPSSVADKLRLYLGQSLSEVWQSRVKVWADYLNGLSSWRVLLGDGLMGYYRASLVTKGVAAFTPLNNGPMEVFNAGGVVFLLFYLLVILVGFSTLSKSEGANTSFLAIVVGFTCAFLIYTIVTNERLLFSSHFMSFGVAYLFSCYPARKKVSLV